MSQKKLRPGSDENPKVTKVTLEFDDGKTRYLEGKEAQKYIDHINSVLSFMQATRSYMLPKDFLQVKWKEV